MAQLTPVIINLEIVLKSFQLTELAVWAKNILPATYTLLKTIQ